MKKLLLSLALVLGVASASHAARASVRTVTSSTTPVLAFSGVGSVYAVVLSSGTGFAVLRDSGTANATSTPLTPYLGMTTYPQVIKFDPPIPVANGLSVNLSTAGNTDGVTVMYQSGRY